MSVLAIYDRCHHNVLCVDHFPLQFVLPSARANEITIDISIDTTPPPLCAFISPTADSSRVFYRRKFTLPFLPTFVGTNQVSNGNLHVLTHNEVDVTSFKGMVNFQCEVSTAWESASSNIYTIDSKYTSINLV